jgi:hypothetical protein
MVSTTTTQAVAKISIHHLPFNYLPYLCAAFLETIPNVVLFQCT